MYHRASLCEHIPIRKLGANSVPEKAHSFRDVVLSRQCQGPFGAIPPASQRTPKSSMSLINKSG